MRTHAQMLQPRILGQRHRDGRAQAAGVGVSVDEVAHCAQVRGVFGECEADRRFQGLRAVGVEQLQEPAGEHTQMGTAFSGAQEQRGCAGRGVMQAVLCAMRARGAFVSDKSLDMGRLFDLHAAIRCCAGEWQ